MASAFKPGVLGSWAANNPVFMNAADTIMGRNAQPQQAQQVEFNPAESFLQQSMSGPGPSTPPSLTALLNMSASPIPMNPNLAGGIASSQSNAPQFEPQQQQTSNAAWADNRRNNIMESLYSYEVGGQIGMGGMPTSPQPGQMPGGAGLAPPGAAQKPMNPQQLQAAAQQFVQQHPQQVQKIQMVIQQALQSGQMTQQQLNMMVQLATVALQNPEMYPQLRKLAIQNGLATEQDISQQYDQGLLFILVTVGQSLQAGGQQPPRPIPSMKGGGHIPNQGTAKSDPVVIQAHEGEYVIPAHIVKAKGTEFFDSLLKKYAEDQNGGNDSTTDS
jgi:hypothetical protein